MRVGDKVEVVIVHPYDVAVWVVKGMVGEIVKVYPSGSYRYHVRFDGDRVEDFAREEISPVKEA